MNPTIRMQDTMMEAQRYGVSKDGKVGCRQSKPSKACSPGNKGNWKVSTIWYYEGKRVSYKKCQELVKASFV